MLDGIIDEESIREAQKTAIDERKSLVAQLTDANLASFEQIAMAGSREFGLPLLDLKAYDLAQTPVKGFSERLIRKNRALPLYERGNTLFIAISDPTNLPAIEEFKFASGRKIEAVLAEHDKLLAAIDDALAEHATHLGGIDDADLENIELTSEERQDGTDIEDDDADDAPVIRYVNKILLDAIRKGASDIHFEPYEHRYRVRYRLDGILYKAGKPPVGIGSRLAARIKVLSSLNLAERRIPQDGRIKLNLSNSRAIDFRVSTCPTLWGEKIVLRLLDASNNNLNIEDLGYDEQQKALFMKHLAKPYGMILVTGPTGSGKSVSLYSGISMLNTSNRNISTVEDPVEINMEGINQVSVRPHVGLTFATTLRAFLRQDPDVIMVGEIRDLETAEIAIKAAQTGHLVLSTLHTNDAPQTLTRLVNMGVPAYNIASSIGLIIAQRLIRKLCDYCKHTVDIPQQELLKEGFRADEIDSLEIYEAEGCNQCNDGYKGRIGVFQVMEVSEAIGRIIMEGGNADLIQQQAEQEGVIDLRKSGLDKVRAGITSLTEVNRVTLDSPT